MVLCAVTDCRTDYSCWKLTREARRRLEKPSTESAFQQVAGSAVHVHTEVGE